MGNLLRNEKTVGGRNVSAASIIYSHAQNNYRRSRICGCTGVYWYPPFRIHMESRHYHSVGSRIRPIGYLCSCICRRTTGRNRCIGRRFHHLLHFCSLGNFGNYKTYALLQPGKLREILLIGSRSVVAFPQFESQGKY